jgi:phosphoribosylformylglycinamidine synthase
MRFDVVVEIRSLDGLADPQGQTIERALPALGFVGVEGVHVGKVIRFAIESPDERAAGAEVQQLCDRLLANPVMERAHILLTAAAEAATVRETLSGQTAGGSP